MLRTDYILRMVEQLGAAMVRIARARDAGDLETVAELLEEASAAQLGLSLSVVTGQPVEQLRALLSTSGEWDPGKCIVAGELLVQSAALLQQRAQDAQASALRRRALELLLAGYRVLPNRERTLYANKIVDLLGQLPEDAVDQGEQLRLVGVYEAAGRYDKAEDLLFALVEDGVDGALDYGRALYADLLRRKDEDLERGGLPRDEVKQGLAELERGRDASR